LQGKIETATAAFGEKPEKKSFSAHLTLGRVKEIRLLDAAALHRFMETQTAGVCGQWPVNELELIRSELGNAGAKHSLISRHSLGRG